MQTLTWEGSVRWGVGVLSPACESCVGLIEIDPDSVTDVSDREANPEDCDADLIDESAEIDVAALMTTAEGGFPWLTMALVDLATAQEVGLQPNNAVTLQQTQDDIADAGGELTHIGFVDVSDATILGPARFDLPALGAAPPEKGAPFGAFWTFSRDPATNPHPAGIDLDGDYSLGSFWQSGG